MAGVVDEMVEVRPVPVERLATEVGMNAASFHQRFKAITSLSPLQVQKHCAWSKRDG